MTNLFFNYQRKRWRLSGARSAKTWQFKKPGVFSRLSRLFWTRATCTSVPEQQSVPEILISGPGGTLLEGDASIPTTLSDPDKITEDKKGGVNGNSLSQFPQEDCVQPSHSPVDTRPKSRSCIPLSDSDLQLREQLQSERPDSILINKKRIRKSGGQGCDSIEVPLRPPFFAASASRDNRLSDCSGIQFQQTPEIIEAVSYSLRKNENIPA
ncbi:Hypothetical protein YALIH222_S02E33892G [Yarrowia lipolytica]|nr:Hypothetical protein YALIH222_S02E33892G [Yarrowia lipolytica]